MLPVIKQKQMVHFSSCQLRENLSDGLSLQ